MNLTHFIENHLQKINFMSHVSRYNDIKHSKGSCFLEMFYQNIECCCIKPRETFFLSAHKVEQIPNLARLTSCCVNEVIINPLIHKSSLENGSKRYDVLFANELAIATNSLQIADQIKRLHL